MSDEKKNRISYFLDAEGKVRFEKSEWKSSGIFEIGGYLPKEDSYDALVQILRNEVDNTIFVETEFGTSPYPKKKDDGVRSVAEVRSRWTPVRERQAKVIAHIDTSSQRLDAIYIEQVDKDGCVHKVKVDSEFFSLFSDDVLEAIKLVGKARGG